MTLFSSSSISSAQTKSNEKTQPVIHPVQIRKAAPMVQQRSIRHWSRFQGCGALAFVGLLLTVVSCVASFALYIVFPPAPLDIVVMGLDARQNEGRATRTDSIVLVGVDTDDIRVNLLSIPRDLFVDVPGYGMQRINTVNVLAEANTTGTGPQLLSETIARNFDIQPDRYVRLDFQAFIALVDAIGGVTIDVPREIVDYQYPTPDYGTRQLRIPAGVQHMDGETALAYARTRHIDDDYGRAARQQQIVTALTKKLLNPIYWTPALAALNQHTETNLNAFDLIKIVPPLLLRGGNTEQLVINRDYIQGTSAGYAIPDYDKLRPWIAPRFD